MFGRKSKNKKEKAVTQVETETPDLEIPKEPEVKVEPKEEVKVEPKEEVIEEPKEMPTEEALEKEKAELEKKIKKLKESEPETPTNYVRIVGGELLKDGVYRYTLITNYSLGEIGEEITE